ncbi:uncharacterized protein BKA78DRAFT_309717 [Phyllosticta capitalensis]|uniref:uncharacterized protein n=1 Tax=Phyllosticta capitalensis TaxID=121624 RepID=UPI00312CFB24
MQFIFITFLALLVALVAARPQDVSTDSTSNKEIKGDCGVIGFLKPGEFNGLTKDVPLDPKNRVLPYRVDILGCIASCKQQLGEPTSDGKGCQTVLWSLQFGNCGFSSTKFDSAINRDKRGDEVFYKLNCYDKYKDGKSTFPVIAPGQD